MSDWKEYAREVLRDSFVLWERGEHLAMFAGVVLASILFGVVLALGVGITFKPIAGMWVSAGLLTWLVILILVVSPYRVWAQERKKVQNYEEAEKQKINVNWRVRSNRFAELILTNVSSKTLPRVNLSFRNYRKPDGSDVKDVLCDMISVGGREPSTTLDPRVQTFYRFARIIEEGAGNTFIELTPSGTNTIRLIGREVGVKFAVSGEHILSQPIVLRLTLNDDGSLSIEPWKIGENAVRPAEVA